MKDIQAIYKLHTSYVQAIYMKDIQKLKRGPFKMLCQFVQFKLANLLKQLYGMIAPI